MYPFASDILYDLFGIDLPFDIFSFGLMVAVGVLIAGWLLQKELDRLFSARLVPGVEIRDKKNKTALVSPSYLVGTIMTITVFVGFAGAKLFHILENWSSFLLDPAGMIFSSGGFTFYGGLVLAVPAVMLFVRSKGVPGLRIADAAAPGLMLAYGIGRIGCYLAGDGDWGVCSQLSNKPGWLPDFLWSETFPRNILGPERQPVNVLEYMNCPPGADGVYPAMLYEFLMAVILFVVLWSLRKHRHAAGWLFGLYLVLAGLERFVIEQIRVNNVGTFLGVEATQAEVISVVLVLLGAVLIWVKREQLGRGPSGAPDGRDPV